MAMRRGHTERCRRCKETVLHLLHKLYGTIEENKKFAIGARLSDYENTTAHKPLSRILSTLESYRGFRDFVGVKTLPHCDYFVPRKNFIVEFDESQHFTLPRLKSLQVYPSSLSLGFKRQRWIAICRKTLAKDNDPPYRDEQRAWYDTLRDFLPLTLCLHPTVRIYAKDMAWCDLKVSRRDDIRVFDLYLAKNFFKDRGRRTPNGN